MKLSPGQFFTTASIMRDRCTGTPKVCISVNKSRVYYRRIFTNADGKWAEQRQAEVNASKPEYCDIKSVQLVCDTLEEIAEIDAAAEQNFREVCAIQKAHNKKFMAQAADIRAKHKKV